MTFSVVRSIPFLRRRQEKKQQKQQLQLSSSNPSKSNPSKSFNRKKKKPSAAAAYEKACLSSSHVSVDTCGTVSTTTSRRSSASSSRRSSASSSRRSSVSSLTGDDSVSLASTAQFPAQFPLISKDEQPEGVDIVPPSTTTSVEDGHNDDSFHDDYLMVSGLRHRPPSPPSRRSLRSPSPRRVRLDSMLVMLQEVDSTVDEHQSSSSSSESLSRHRSPSPSSDVSLLEDSVDSVVSSLEEPEEPQPSPALERALKLSRSFNDSTRRFQESTRNYQQLQKVWEQELQQQCHKPPPSPPLPLPLHLRKEGTRTTSYRKQNKLSSSRRRDTPLVGGGGKLSDMKERSSSCGRNVGGGGGHELSNLEQFLAIKKKTTVRETSSVGDKVRGIYDEVKIGVGHDVNPPGVNDKVSPQDGNGGKHQHCETESIESPQQRKPDPPNSDPPKLCHPTSADLPPRADPPPAASFDSQDSECCSDLLSPPPPFGLRILNTRRGSSPVPHGFHQRVRRCSPVRSVESPMPSKCNKQERQHRERPQRRERERDQPVPPPPPQRPAAVIRTPPMGHISVLTAPQKKSKSNNTKARSSMKSFARSTMSLMRPGKHNKKCDRRNDKERDSKKNNGNHGGHVDIRRTADISTFSSLSSGTASTNPASSRSSSRISRSNEKEYRRSSSRRNSRKDKEYRSKENTSGGYNYENNKKNVENALNHHSGSSPSNNVNNISSRNLKVTSAIPNNGSSPSSFPSSSVLSCITTSSHFNNVNNSSSRNLSATPNRSSPSSFPSSSVLSCLTTNTGEYRPPRHGARVKTERKERSSRRECSYSQDDERQKDRHNKSSSTRRKHHRHRSREEKHEQEGNGSSTNHRRKNTKDDELELFIDPVTANGTFRHPTSKDLSFEISKGRGTFVHPKNPNMTFDMEMIFDLPPNDPTTTTEEEHEGQEQGARGCRYFLECSLGNLSDIRLDNRNKNILGTLGHWNAVQKRRSAGKETTKNRALLVIDSKGATSPENKKEQSEVVATLSGRLGVECTTMKQWNVEAGFRKDLECFIEDASEFYRRLHTTKK